MTHETLLGLSFEPNNRVFPTRGATGGVGNSSVGPKPTVELEFAAIETYGKASWCCD
jgi:hypothetical protein